MNRSINVTFDFDAEEHYRALGEVTRSLIWRYISWALTAVLFAFVIYVIAVNWRTAPPLHLFLYVLPWVLLGAFWATFLPLAQRRTARKWQERDPSAIGPQERSVDHLGYHSRGNGVILEFPWHAMHRARETGEFFLFYLNKNTAFYIPKRVLSEIEMSELRALLRTHLAERASVVG